MPKLDKMVAFGILILAIIFLALYSYYHKSGKASLPAGWTHYTSEKYGFQFDYPASWGSPSFTLAQGNKGKSYTVSFASDPRLASTNSGVSVKFDMDSEDYISKDCGSGSCPVAYQTTTKKSILSDLKSTAPFVKRDASSYGLVTSVPGYTSLRLKRIIQLPALKVSAVTATYSISRAGSCPKDKLAPSTESHCISQTDYNNLNNSLKSIKAI